MNEITGATPADAPPQEQHNGQPPADVANASEPSGFGSRGRIRRRARFLRKARELAYRDLGGLLFNLHRFSQRNDALVLAKLTTLAQIDSELRTLETALGRREPVTVLREAGINACPRCAAIHSSEDRFCPNCGLSMARHVDLPIAGAAAAPAVPAPVPAQPTTTPAAPAPPLAAPIPPAPAPAPAPQAAVPATPAPTPTPTAPPAPATDTPDATSPAPIPSASSIANSPQEPPAPASEAAPVPAQAEPAGRAPLPPHNATDRGTGDRDGEHHFTASVAPDPAHASGTDEITEIIKPQPPRS